MIQRAKRVIVVHDNEGLALAVLFIEEQAAEDKGRTGQKPVLREGQRMAELELDEEQHQLTLEELLQHQVIYAGQKPALRRRIITSPVP